MQESSRTDATTRCQRPSAVLLWVDALATWLFCNYIIMMSLLILFRSYRSVDGGVSELDGEAIEVLAVHCGNLQGVELLTVVGCFSHDVSIAGGGRL